MLPFRKRTRKASVKAGEEATSPNRLFGVPFDRNAESIPIVIRQVVEYFEQSEQGQQSDIKKIVEQFDSGEVPDLKGYDPHVAAGVLKQYLRELPEPLLTFELYDCFLAAASVPETAQASTVRKVLCMLPLSHRIVLKYLARFLHRVSLEANTNKMTPANIAIVFAPNLLKPPGDDLLMQMRDTEFSNHLMILFISEFDSIFVEEPDPGQPSRSAQPLSRRHRRSSSWSGSQAELDELMSDVPILHPTEAERTPQIDSSYLRSGSQPAGFAAGRSAGFTISRSRPGDLTSSGELRVASPTRPIHGSPPASPPPSKKLPPKPSPRHRSATNTNAGAGNNTFDRPSSPLARSPMPVVRSRNRTETVSVDDTLQTAAPYVAPNAKMLASTQSSRGFRGRGQLLRGTAPSSSARHVVPLPQRGGNRGGGPGRGLPPRGRGRGGTATPPANRARPAAASERI